MNTGKVLLGVLVGAAAGVILGILFAPNKGSETRKNIAKKSDDYADALKDKYNELMKGLAEKCDDTKNDSKSYAHDEKAEANTFKTDAKNSIG